MNRACVWLATLTATGLAAAAEARAFTAQGPGGPNLGRLVAGPESHTPAPAVSKPAPSQSGGYNFSGSSFNLSVTKHGRAPPPAAPPEPPKVAAPDDSPGASHPGFIRRLLDWVTGG
jgi:hypothetical protein